MDSRDNYLSLSLQQDALARCLAAGEPGTLTSYHEGVITPCSNVHRDGPHPELNANGVNFTQPQPHLNDVFPPPFVNGHGNDSHLGLNANGFNCTQPQFYPSGVHTPAFITGHDDGPHPDLNTNEVNFIQSEFHPNDVFTPTLFNGSGHDSHLSLNANEVNFTQPQFYPDGIHTPAFTAGHGDDAQLGMNANGSNFTQPQLYPDGVYTPAFITGYGKDSQLGMDANGSNFIQPQFITNSVSGPSVSNPAGSVNGQSLLNVSGFANISGCFNNFSPSFSAQGFNRGNNPLSNMGVVGSHYGNNPLPTMGAYSYNYGNYPLPPLNDMYDPSLTTPAQVSDGASTLTSPGSLAANPFVSPTNSAAAEPPATAPRAMYACPVCEKTFGRPSDLKRHEAKHRGGDKDFSCPSTDCPYKGPKGFTRKDKMRDHVKNMHPEIDARKL